MFIKVKYYGASEFETNRFDTAIKDYQVRHGILTPILLAHCKMILCQVASLHTVPKTTCGNVKLCGQRLN